MFLINLPAAGSIRNGSQCCIFGYPKSNVPGILSRQSDLGHPALRAFCMSSRPPAHIPIRIRTAVVPVPGENASVGPVVPVATRDRPKPSMSNIALIGSRKYESNILCIFPLRQCASELPGVSANRYISTHTTNSPTASVIHGPS